MLVVDEVDGYLRDCGGGRPWKGLPMHGRKGAGDIL